MSDGLEKYRICGDNLYLDSFAKIIGFGNILMMSAMGLITCKGIHGGEFG